MTHLRRSFWAVFGDLFFKNCTYYRLYLRDKMSLTLFNFSQRHELPGLLSEYETNTTLLLIRSKGDKRVKPNIYSL